MARKKIPAGNENTVVEPGKWYWSLPACNKCKQPFPVLEDKYNGQSGTTLEGDGKIDATCPFCGERGTYLGRTMRSCQAVKADTH